MTTVEGNQHSYVMYSERARLFKAGIAQDPRRRNSSARTWVPDYQLLWTFPYGKELEDFFKVELAEYRVGKSEAYRELKCEDCDDDLHEWNEQCRGERDPLDEEDFVELAMLFDRTKGDERIIKSSIRKATSLGININGVDFSKPLEEYPEPSEDSFERARKIMDEWRLVRSDV